MNLIKKIIVNLLLYRGYKLTKITKRRDIVRLIKSLYPYRTQYDLIRLGPNGDGGYLVPNCLEGIDACFSPGVSDVSGFELDCINRNMFVFMADKSVDKPNLTVSVNGYNFIKKFIGNTNDDDFITMDEWVKSSDLSNNSELLLQMDIEGAEYDAFINMSESLLNKFRLMVIEFHSLDRMWEPHFYKTVQSVFDKILRTHICVHNHPNNCYGIDCQNDIEIPRIIELTFLRKDFASLKKYEIVFPNKLDFDNTLNEHIVLPRNWHYHK